MAQVQTVATKLQEVDARTLKAWLEAGEAMLLDVREPAEHAAAHIPQATLMPSSRFDVGAVPRDAGIKIVVHCAAGMRASKVCEDLAQCGCQNVYLFRDGVKGWQEAGYEVVGSGRGPLPVIRQVQLVVGTMVLVGTLLGAFVAPTWLIVPGFAGCGLLMAGSTGKCALADVLARMPWNQKVGSGGSCCAR